jgi:hypothetical protein
MNDLRKERDAHIEDARFHDFEGQRMFNCVKEAGYCFIIEKQKTVKMVPIVYKTPKTTNDIMMY